MICRMDHGIVLVCTNTAVPISARLRGGKQQQSVPSSSSSSMNTPEIRDEADPDNEDLEIGIIGKRNRKQKTK